MDDGLVILNPGPYEFRVPAMDRLIEVIEWRLTRWPEGAEL